MEHTNPHIKVLVVDDDKFLLDMYALKFKKAGIDINSYSSTVEALEHIRAGEECDVLILDIIMPQMDGLELLKTIRAEKLLPKAKVMMLTNQSEDFNKAKELGIDGYVVKATAIPSEVVTKVLSIYNNT